MKSPILAALGVTVTLFAPPALAQTATGTGTGIGVSSSTSSASANSGGSTSAVIFNTPGSTQTRIRQSGSLKTTPNAIAPGLGSAAIETCYGPGVSGGVSVTGFGASFGAGQWDTSCNRRLNARTIYAFGYKRQALSIMLNEPEVANAFGYGQQVAGSAPVGYAQPVAAAPRLKINGIEQVYR